MIQHTSDGRKIKILVPQNTVQAKIAAAVGQSGETSTNDRLFKLYIQHWPKFSTLLPTDAGFSVPILCSETNAYVSSKVRLLVVGQQTRHWLRESMGSWSEDHFSSKARAHEAIRSMMLQYAAFLATDREKNRGFFRAARQIQHTINPASEAEDAFLWRNLFICDQDGREPAKNFHDRLRQLSPLDAELRILRPDVVVFMTGQRFDFTLKAALGQHAISAYSPAVDAKYLARVAIPHSSAIGFRIPHPRNPKHTIWIQEVIKAIERDLKVRTTR